MKATGFSHLLPFRGGDAERRVHLIIGLSASVFMLDFRFCPAQTLETAGGCVCVRVGVCVCAGTVDRLVSGSHKKSHTTGHHLLYLYLGF